MIAMGGNLGLDIDLARVPAEIGLRNDTLLFSESAGRFIATVAPEFQDEFEKICADIPCACIGTVMEQPILKIAGKDQKNLVSVAVADLKAAWKKPFGSLV
jgi:phosphoribosylformylglycinamidine synthase